MNLTPLGWRILGCIGAAMVGLGVSGLAGQLSAGLVITGAALYGLASC